MCVILIRFFYSIDPTFSFWLHFWNEQHSHFQTHPIFILIEVFTQSVMEVLVENQTFGVFCYLPAILALERWKQMDYKFETSMTYKVRLSKRKERRRNEKRKGEERKEGKNGRKERWKEERKIFDFFSTGWRKIWLQFNGEIFRGNIELFLTVQTLQWL